MVERNPLLTLISHLVLLLGVAAGLGLGLLAGAVIPRRAGSKLGKRAVALATVWTLPAVVSTDSLTAWAAS